MTKALIFDMDGLLLDTEKYLVKYWMEAARERGYALTREHALTLRSLTEKYAQRYLKDIFGEEFDYPGIRARRRQLTKEHIEACGVEKKPGVEMLLTYARAHGYKTAVATATSLERARYYLHMAGIEDLFDQVISAELVPIGKPMPDVYLYACAQVGEKPEDCIAFEDSPNGVTSAYRAGCRVIMVPDLTQPDEELRKMLYARVDCLDEVPALLASEK